MKTPPAEMGAAELLVSLITVTQLRQAYGAKGHRARAQIDQDYHHLYSEVLRRLQDRDAAKWVGSMGNSSSIDVLRVEQEESY